MGGQRTASNANERGSAADRRARRAWMLQHFDPDLGPAQARCAVANHSKCVGVVDEATMQVDRILPGVMGGTYVRDNIQPACHWCNNLRAVEEREYRHRISCDGSCRRCRMQQEYRAARAAAEAAREQATYGYATEEAGYGPIVTFRDWLVAHGGERA